MKQTPVIALPERLVERYTAAHAVNPDATANLVYQLVGRLDRVIKQAQAAPDMIDQHVRPSFGPALRFIGRCIYEYEAERAVRQKYVAVFETVGGALVAELHFLDRDGHEVSKAEAFDQADMLDRQIALMDFLGWSITARKMAKQMGWILERTIA